MLFKQRFTLKTKQLIFLTFFLLVPIFIFGIISQDNSITYVYQYKANEYSKIISQIDSVVDNWLTNSSKLASIISELPLAKENKSIDINMAMRKFIKKFNRFSRLRFFDLSKNVIVEEPLPSKKVNSIYNIYLDRVMTSEREIISNVYNDPNSSKPLLTIFKPSFNEVKKLSYILSADVNLSEIENKILRETPRDSIKIMVIDKNDKFILGNNNNKLFDYLSKNSGNVISKYYPFMKSIDVNGEKYVYLRKYNKSTGWKLYLFEKEKDAFYQINQTKKSMAYLIIVCSLLLIFSGFVVTSKMTNSIKILAEATEEIANQNYDIKIDIHSNDEIEELANSFLYMAGELKKSRIEIETLNTVLEKKVEERTKELINNKNTLDALLSGMVDDVLMINKEGIILYCNQNFIKKYGNKKGEKIDNNPEIANKKILSLLNDVKSSKKLKRETIKLIFKNEVTYIDVIATPLFDENSEFIGILEVIRDVTEHAINDKKLTKLKDYYKEIISSLKEGIIITDSSYNIEDDNPSSIEILGQNADSISGKNLQEIFSQLDIIPSPIEFLYPEFNEQVQCSYKLKDGTKKHILISTANLANNKILWLVADLTTIKELEHQLIQSDKLASLGQLMAGMAHEINNPLTGILGFTSLLKSKEKEPFKIEMLSRIINSSHRINNIIVNMKHFASPSKQVMSKTNINKLIEQSLILLENESSKYKVKIECKYGDVEDSFMDTNQIQQVITNIVINSFHAIHEKNETGLIIIETEKSGENIIIRIQDNGIGIPEKSLTKIFDPFFTTKSDWNGTGLGLSICYTIIKNHNGRILIDSVVNKGTKVEIIIPIVKEGIKTDKKNLEYVREYSKEKEEFLPEKILLVEDEQYIREMFETFPSYYINSVDSGEKALELVENEEFDLIIVDLRLPDILGDELINKLEKLSPDSRFMLITGCTKDDELVKNARKNCSAKIVFKPFTIQDMINHFENWNS